MKLSGKHWGILAIGVIALVLVYYFLFGKKSAESSFDPNLLILGGPDSRTVRPNNGPLNRAVVPGVKPFALSGVGNAGRVRFTAPITNKPQGCPSGSHQTKLPDGSYSCIPNVA